MTLTPSLPVSKTMKCPKKSPMTTWTRKLTTTMTGGTMTSGDPFVSDEVLALREKASNTYRHYVLLKGCACLGLIYIFMAGSYSPN